MPITRHTYDTGTTIKPGPMVVAQPGRVVLDDDLAGIAGDSGLNGGFLADLLASCAVHENMGINLFRFLASTTDNPMLLPRYKQFEGEAATAVEAWERLITRLGGRLGYISPAGRMTEGLDSKVIESFLGAGSADPLTIDLKGVEAVLLASTMCVANVGLVRSLAASLPEGSEARVAMEDAVSELAGPAEEHLEWAAGMQQKMVLTQASSKAAQTVGAVVEGVAAKVKSILKR